MRSTVTQVRPDERSALFQERVRALVSMHPVVTSNAYTRWFEAGDLSLEDVRFFTQQFSVFSHQFIVAQLQKVINSADLESYRQGKEILMNELGVVFRPKDGSKGKGLDGVDPDVVGVEGTVDGASYRHAAAHFEWLANFAKPLGLDFTNLGKPRHAIPSTRLFCEAVKHVYGGEDPSMAAGASFAIENWAAAGFWKQLIRGLEAFKKKSGLPLNLGFWVFHDKLEDQHADHTADELGADFGQDWFDEERFIQGASQILDAVQAFWDGLDGQRNGPRQVAQAPTRRPVSDGR